MAFLDYVVQIATAISLLATAAAAVWTLCAYRLKVAAERRLQESTRAEVDIRTMQLFAETMRIAQSRGGSHISEKCVEQLFRRRIITKEDFEGLDDEEKYQELFSKLRTCVIPVPTAKASQDAAIAAIAVLARQYEILRRPAEAGLKALSQGRAQKRQAEEALAYLGEVEPAEMQ